MDLAIPDHISSQISKRCLRCYSEQQWYGEKFLFDYIGDENVSGEKILEIGCAEAGLLKFYSKKGAICSGLEFSDIRYKNAVLLNQDNSIHLFQANICDSKSYKNKLLGVYDTIVIRDVIEHIYDKRKALSNIYDILKPRGKVFMSFPPKYCAYAGHQQTIPIILGKIPFLHMLPNIIYKFYLKLIGCPGKKIEYLLNTKKTRISISQMDLLVNELGFKIRKKSNWLIRPAYSFRFGLKPLKNPFDWAPLLNELFCNGVLYLLEKEEK